MVEMRGEGTLTVGGERIAPHYFPVLKGRLGEMKALSELDRRHVPWVTPLLELTGVDLEEDEEGNPVDPVAQSIDRSIEIFTSRLAPRWADRGPLIIDAAAVPGARDNPYYSPMAQALERLTYAGLHVRPTVRPSDSPDALRLVGQVMDNHGIRDVCLRMADEDLDDTEQPVTVGIERTLNLLGVEPNRVDLLLDFAAIPDERTASFASRIARLVLSGVPHRDDWRHVAVVGGAFPSDLNGVQPGVPTELPRYDVTLHEFVSKHAAGARALDYGDYAIANPVQVTGVGFAPAPQIRYTTDKAWIVIKGLRRDPRASQQFFDICRQLMTVTRVDATSSWGDDYIVRAAAASEDATQTDVKPGNAMTWRAIGTSHHIAKVVSDLASRGAP